MDFIAYQQLFVDILSAPAPAAPYHQPDYLNYVKLNWSRQQRWLKTGLINNDLAALVQSIKHQQIWTVITEPWCGDAAHIVPFINRVASINPLITADYQLRDSEPFLIDSYLTNGASKSIPKLIIADSKHHDLAVWGPRPAGAQQLFNQLVAQHVEMDQKKIALQKWYNEDKGVSLQQELLVLLHQITA